MGSWWRNRGSTEGDASQSDISTPVYIHTLAADGSSRVRGALAANPFTPVAVLRTLALDSGTSQTRVASNPNLPHDNLARLASHASVDVRAAVASNTRIPRDLQRALAKDEHDHVRSRLSENRGVDMSLVLSLVNSRTKEKVKNLALSSDEKLRSIAARHPGTSASDLTTLSADASSSVRSGVASNPSTPTVILHELVADSSGKVRRGLANNPATPRDVLRVLATDADLGIRLQAGLNPNIPQDVFIDLFSSGSSSPDPGESEEYIEAQDPSTSPARLADLAKDKDAEIRAGVAKNPAVPPSVISALLWDSDETVRIALAENPIAGRSTIAADETSAPAILKMLSRDWHWAVRAAVARNANVPREELETLGKDPNALVRVDSVARMALSVTSLQHLYSAVLSDVPEDKRVVVLHRLPAETALFLAKDPETEETILRALWGGVPDQKVMSAIVSHPAVSASLLGDIAQGCDSPSIQALALLNPRIERRAAETALNDPAVSAAVMATGSEIPDWAVSPRLLLNVTTLDDTQCSRLLTHPTSTTSTRGHIAKQMNDVAASALAARSDTTAELLDVLAQTRSDYWTLIAIAKNPQRTRETLLTLLRSSQEGVVESALQGLRETLSVSQVAEILISLPRESMHVAVSSLSPVDAHELATDPNTSEDVHRTLVEHYQVEAVQLALVSNPTISADLLALISETGCSPIVRAHAALNPRTDRVAAETALADPQVSGALMDSEIELPAWVLCPTPLIDVTSLRPDQFIRLLSHPSVTPETVLTSLAPPRSYEQLLGAMATNPSATYGIIAHERLLMTVASSPDCTPAILTALVQLGIPNVSKAAATSQNAPRDVRRDWLQSLDVESRIRLAGETNLGPDLQRELSRDSSMQVRESLLANPQLNQEVATVMRRQIALQLPD